MVLCGRCISDGRRCSHSAERSVGTEKALHLGGDRNEISVLLTWARCIGKQRVLWKTAARGPRRETNPRLHRRRNRCLLH